MNINKPYGYQYDFMRKTWKDNLKRLESQYGFRYKISILTDDQKRLMYLKNPIVAAIVQTRKMQLSMFTVPQKDKYSSGFRWVKKEPRNLHTILR